MKLFRFAVRFFIGFVVSLLLAMPATAESVLEKYLPRIVAGDVVEGADGFGPSRRTCRLPRF